MRTRFLCALFCVILAVQTAPAAGKRYAVCIGVNQYTSDKLDALGQAVADATALAGVLRDAGYEVALLTPAATRTDPTAAPTSANIAARLAALCADKNPSDTVVVAFIGHGVRFPNDPDYYLCPKDGQLAPDQKRTLISLADIYARLGRCGAGGKVLLCDGCRTDPTPGQIRVPNDVLEAAPPPGVFALFACAPKERGYEHAALGHGVFTHHLLAELNPPARDANADIDFAALATHVCREAPATAARWLGPGARQTPTARVGSGLSPVLLTPADTRLLADRAEVREIWARGGKTDEYVERVAVQRIGEWKEAAERGSAIASFLFANCLRTGHGTGQNVKAAVEWYRKAVAQGKTAAMAYVANGYPDNAEVGQSANAVSAWNNQAADLWDGSAILGAEKVQACTIVVKADEKLKTMWHNQNVITGTPQTISRLDDYWAIMGRETGMESRVLMVNDASALIHPAVTATLEAGKVPTGTVVVKADGKLKAVWHNQNIVPGTPQTISGLEGYWTGTGFGTSTEATVLMVNDAFELIHPTVTATVVFHSEGERETGGEANEAPDWYRKTVTSHESLAMSLLENGCSQSPVVKPHAKAAWYRKATDLNHPQTMRELGTRYAKGLGVKQDAQAAVAWYGKAAAANNSEAMKELAACYMTGFGVQPDAKMAAAWYRKAADLNNPGAMTELGICYGNGTGVKQDDKEAAAWFRKASALNEPRAMGKLGICYTLGLGVGRDQKEALNWFRKAAALNDPQGMIRLGYGLFKGIGVTQDTAEAVALFRKANAINETLALKELRACYLLPVTRGASEKMAELRQAADRNDPRAMTDLGICYRDGVGVRKDPERAAMWFHKAATLNEPKAACSLGCCYETGFGVEQNAEKAVEWYLKAAARDNGRAMVYLWNCYMNGVGVKPDYSQALVWLHKAIALNEPTALYEMGREYGCGFVVEKNKKEALEWYRKAAALNEPQAIIELGNCYEEGIGANEDEKEAVAWYRKGAALNDPKAMYYLGRCYEFGVGVTPDLTEAIAWYWLAKAGGNDIAAVALKRLKED
ncbi:caspase family protein [Fimbriiglobus ruber]|uniref:Tetratricopeptide repeat family protein n=1 Tax=Fimbriiglobus ruber TaxID=1908690 RepID=A0A225DNL6_9BACT|nr:caspase family protein [Fimbriiglobus ruber]OWK42982.1 Tetratricopeptide repeat family protein [Fimbriiglobus ruber]